MFAAISRTAWHWIQREMPWGRFKSDMLVSITYMFSANILTSIISLAAGLLTARWVSPSQMGAWAAARVLVPYVSMLHLGVFSGLNRELPFHLGKNQRGEAVLYAQASLAWAWRISLFIIGMSLIGWGWLLYRGKAELAWAVLSLCISMGLGFFVQHYSATYKSHSEFSRLARRNVLVAIVGIPLMTIVWLFNYWGLLVRYFGLQLLSLLTLLKTPPFPVRPRWDWEHFIHLVKVGIPITLLGNSVEALRTLGSIAITRHSGTEMLGLYFVALQVSSVSTLIPSTVMTVIYPAMSRSYGAMGKALPVFWMSCRAGLLVLVGGGLVAILGWFAIPQFVTLLLPNYIEGIGAAQWSTLIPFVGALTVIESVFNVLKRQDLFFLSAMISVVVFLVAWTYFSSLGSGTDVLIAAAKANLLSLQARSITSLCLAGWLSFRHDRRLL